MKAISNIDAIARLGVVLLGISHALGCGAVEEPDTVKELDDQKVYIVLYDSAVSTAYVEASIQKHLSSQETAAIEYRFHSIVRGFAGRLLAGTRQRLSTDAMVRAVTADAPVYLQAVPWGLDRLDQQDLPLDDAYGTYGVAGAGVHVYVVDSGIRATHQDFEDRVAEGYSVFDDGLGTGDCEGHGTHVAATIGGVDSGVAKSVIMHPVRVFQCKKESSVANVLQGMDWVAGHVAEHQHPAVLNMSFATIASDETVPLNEAVSALIENGVVAVAAAGNYGADVCYFTPAQLEPVITVGGTTQNDKLVGTSNMGTCVDVLAPGEDILSAGITNDMKLVEKTGTSMAAAHVSGIAALYLGISPQSTAAEVHDTIVQGSVSDKIADLILDTPNQLANIQFLGELDLCTDTGPSDGGVFDDPPTVCLNEALDLVFVIDTTGSMWDDIDAVKQSATEIVETIFSKSGNARVAIIDYRDFPVSPYGGDDDYPHHLVMDFSSNTAEIISGIESLTLGWGNNWDESVYSGLMAAIQGEDDHLGNALGAWRPGAKKRLLLLGDAPPHDPEPFTGYTLQSVLNAASAVGIETVTGGHQPPGTAEVAETVSIYTIHIGHDSTAATYFEALASGTGGEALEAASAAELADVILGVISDIDGENHPPVTDWAVPSVSMLWPPNHQMIEVSIMGVTDPDGDPVTLTITDLTQNEPASTTGANHSPDGTGVGTDRALLRAERNGSGEGRVYRIGFVARDSEGAESEGSVLVCVPHDRGENTTCPSSGLSYDSTLE